MRYPNFSEENRLWRKGFKKVAGLDEAGRGSLGGPVFAAAVIVKKDRKLKLLKVNDSKKLSSKNLLCRLDRTLFLVYCYSITRLKRIKKIMQYRVNIVSPKGEIVRSGLIMDFPKLEQNAKALDMANAMLLAMNGNQIQIVEPVVRSSHLDPYYQIQ